jgi:hypothetical protein
MAQDQMSLATHAVENMLVHDQWLDGMEARRTEDMLEL